jgi:hypothetical protein
VCALPALIVTSILLALSPLRTKQTTPKAIKTPKIAPDIIRILCAVILLIIIKVQLLMYLNK